MNTINTVALIGAGAIGSYFIKGLKDKIGDNLWIIADGERKERLLSSGIVVNGEHITLNVKTPEEAIGADLVVVGVKYKALQGVLSMIETIVDSNTIVMSPMNGVDSEQIIGERIGMEHMLHSFMKIAARRVNNDIKYDPDITLGLFFGEIDGALSERIKAVSDLLDNTTINYNVCDNIEKDMWLKYAMNISKNIPQAIINCGVGGYTDSNNLAYISAKMREEVVAVAKMKNIDISDENNPASSAAGVAPDSRYSTLQDLDAKRETEIDMFCGTLIRLGKEFGIATPYNDFAYHAVKCLEEKNAGIIR